jgi:hypothetical protein
MTAPDQFASARHFTLATGSHPHMTTDTGSRPYASAKMQNEEANG